MIGFTNTDDSIFSRWRPWEKKFALFPRIVNGRLIWLKTYYERSKLAMPQFNDIQRTTSIFDVLKNS